MVQLFVTAKTSPLIKLKINGYWSGDPKYIGSVKFQFLLKPNLLIWVRCSGTSPYPSWVECMLEFSSITKVSETIFIFIKEKIKRKAMIR